MAGELGKPTNHAWAESSFTPACNPIAPTNQLTACGDSRVTHIEELKLVIQKHYGVKATHVGSKPVKEVFQGKTVWDGIVEVFDIQGHPKTHTAYAWLHNTGNPKNPIKRVALLHLPPVVSPLTAMRAFMIREVGKGRH
jgi:hypothetical protein